ncbi:hypothetical protein FB567DRAFT_593516 [Paraphoma chrysanthemicola]|uniref:Uncharacterized protein n=1 Tax=Paraphoma chrysanthemicola TaxID=798071 RepID=A0A8K0R5B0_9PLEO|nr:hypothetical protein FB567DRAFT_593516 [Paraphoma chrysanthemicola]
MNDSFPFLSLAAEIRNMIYSALLEFDTSIHIFDLDGYGLYLHHENIPIEHFKFYGDLDAEHQKARVRAGLSGFGLFLVNRQVHREVSSIFYGNIVFKLCSVCSMVDLDDSNVNARYISHKLLPWFYGLGNHSALLRRLEIDVTKLTSTEWTGGRDLWAAFDDDNSLSGKGLLEFGPLLCHIWEFEITELKVVIVHEQPVAQPGLIQPDCNAVGINEILNSLIQDKLGIKKYWRAIGNVSINRDGSGGIVVFRNKSRPDVTHWSYSNPNQVFLPRDGGTLEKYNSTSTTKFQVVAGHNLRFVIREPRTLLSLPESVRTRILDNVFDERQVINLDTSADFISLLGTFYLMRLCGYASRGFSLPYTLSLEMTFTAPNGSNKTALARQWRLLELLSPFRSPPQISDNARHFQKFAWYTITIGIDGNEGATLRDFRYDAVKIIQATLSLDGSKVIYFRMKNVSDPEFGENWWSIRIAKLRNITFLSWPKITRPFQQELPEIEMNGLGKVSAIRTEQGSIPVTNKNMRTKWSAYWLGRKCDRKRKLISQSYRTDSSIDNTLPEGRSSDELREWLKRESKLGKWES